MKYSAGLLLLIVSTALLVQNCSGGSDYGCSHNYFEGDLNPYDVLLFRTEIKKAGATMFGSGIKTIEEVKFPTSGTRNTARITAIRVFDLDTNSTGGHVDRITYTANRLGVTLRLKSELGKGYRFIIEIFGR